MRPCLEAVAVQLRSGVLEVFLVKDNAATLPSSAPDKVVDAVKGSHRRSLGCETRSGSISSVDRGRL